MIRWIDKFGVYQGRLRDGIHKEVLRFVSEPMGDTMTSGLNLVRENKGHSRDGQGQVCSATARSDKKEKGLADHIHFDLKQNLDLHCK